MRSCKVGFYTSKLYISACRSLPSHAHARNARAARPTHRCLHTVFYPNPVPCRCRFRTPRLPPFASSRAYSVVRVFSDSMASAASTLLRPIGWAGRTIQSGTYETVSIITTGKTLSGHARIHETRLAAAILVQSRARGLLSRRKYRREREQRRKEEQLKEQIRREVQLEERSRREQQQRGFLCFGRYGDSDDTDFHICGFMRKPATRAEREQKVSWKGGFPGVARPPSFSKRERD